jgi:hypothetical protein
MAIVKISTNLLANSPETVQALHEAFYSVESLDTPIGDPFTTFRVQGQGVPQDDTHIMIGFKYSGAEHKTKVEGWDFIK